MDVGVDTAIWIARCFRGNSFVVDLIDQIAAISAGLVTIHHTQCRLCVIVVSRYNSALLWFASFSPSSTIHVAVVVVELRKLALHTSLVALAIQIFRCSLSNYSQHSITLHSCPESSKP